MFNPYSRVTSQIDNFQKIQEELKKLAKTDVLVGIPEEKAGREGTVNNAELMYIHTNGSPINGIPPRPVIEPAIADAKEEIATQLSKAIEKALDGQDGEIELKKAGMLAQNKCRAWFVSPKNGWAPNSPLTITKKKSSRPLVDTGELRKSITYIIRKM